MQRQHQFIAINLFDSCTSLCAEWVNVGIDFCIVDGNRKIQHRTETHNENRYRTQIETCITRNIIENETKSLLFVCVYAGGANSAREWMNIVFQLNYHSLKPAAIELSRLRKKLLMRSQANSIASFLNSLKLSRMSLNRWRRTHTHIQPSPSFHTHACMEMSAHIDGRMKQNKAICYTCYVLPDLDRIKWIQYRHRQCVMRAEEIFENFLFVAFRISIRLVVQSLRANSKQYANESICLFTIPFVFASPSECTKGAREMRHATIRRRRRTHFGIRNNSTLNSCVCLTPCPRRGLWLFHVRSIGRPYVCVVRLILDRQQRLRHTDYVRRTHYSVCKRTSERLLRHDFNYQQMY